MKSKVFLGLAFMFLVPCVVAQQKPQYMPGQQGLNAGIMPEPGFTYANMTISYRSDTLKDANGNTVPTTGSYDVWAIENIFFYVPKFKLAGAKVGFMVATPTFANGSVTLPQFGVSAGGFGVADVWVQPLTLGWNFKRADIWGAYAFVAPTGRYAAGASDNIGSGYWGNHIQTGSTYYLTKNKGTTANLYTDWEVHGEKKESDVTPGQAFTMEWGLGQMLPLDKQFKKILQVGLIGYDIWQVSDNGGLLGVGLPASALPRYSAHAIGFQTTFIMPAKNLTFYFKYEPEYSAKARPEGTTIVLGGSWTFRIPKPAPPKS